jgi:hypothetical protein
MTAIDLILLLATVFYLGYRVGSWWTRANIMEILDEAGFDQHGKRDVVRWAKEEQALANAETREIYLERINGIYYAYDSNTDEFMGQHAEQEELFKLIAKQYGEGRYSVVDRSAN